jgi:Tfp pilus assembly protein PilX
LKIIFTHTSNERGYVLVTALMVLVVLTIIGIISSKSTITELMVSGNDKVHKQTFYMADGGTELAQHLTFHNAICSAASNGFTKNTEYDGNDARIINGTILIQNLTFANETGLTVTDIDDATRAAALFPVSAVTTNAPTTTVDNSANHTNFYTSASSTLLQGSGSQMISGYESLGAGAPGGGSAMRYQIASQHNGLAESQSLVEAGWRLDTFVVRSASTFDCIY